MYKVLLIGDMRVGKTSVFQRFLTGTFSPIHMTTIGVDFQKKEVKLEDNTIVDLQIWDTAGQERFKTITKNYYRGASGIIIVYDITDKTSFDNVSNWLYEVEEKASPDTIKLLIGNKCDLTSERLVSYEEGETFAKENGISFLETSALDANCENIEKAFYEMACKIQEIKSTQSKPEDDKSEIVILSNKREENVSWGDWVYSFC